MLLLFILAIAANALTISDNLQYLSFIKEYNKEYRNYAEQMYRYLIFLRNVKFIEELNRNERGTAVYAVNQFADLTNKQIKALYGLQVDPNYQIKYVANFTNQSVYKPRQDTPDVWNWVQQGAVTGIRNQGSCGSCWAFSTAQNIESQHWMKTKELIDFSEQQLVDCDKSNFGCSGGWPYMAIDWLAKNGGIQTMQDYPTRANYSGPCQFNASKAKLQIKGYMNVTKNETIIKDALYTLGPLSILLDFTGLTYYKSGVASPLFCYTWPDHALLLVGYGTQHEDYWLIKNTWGVKWGQNGYLQLARGKDKCGIADWATTVVFP